MACSAGRSILLLVQVALLGQGKPSGRLVVLVQALTTPTLVAAAAVTSQPAGSFVPGTDVPAVIQVIVCLILLLFTICYTCMHLHFYAGTLYLCSLASWQSTQSDSLTTSVPLLKRCPCLKNCQQCFSPQCQVLIAAK